MRCFVWAWWKAITAFDYLVLNERGGKEDGGYFYIFRRTSTIRNQQNGRWLAKAGTGDEGDCGGDGGGGAGRERASGVLPKWKVKKFSFGDGIVFFPLFFFLLLFVIIILGKCFGGWAIAVVVALRASNDDVYRRIFISIVSRDNALIK